MCSQTGARRRNPDAVCKGPKGVLTGDIVMERGGGAGRWLPGRGATLHSYLGNRLATGSTIALITRLFTSK